MVSAWQRWVNDGEVMWRRERDGWKNSGRGLREQLDGWRDWSCWPYRCSEGGRGNKDMDDPWLESAGFQVPQSVVITPPPSKKKSLWDCGLTAHTHTHPCAHTKIKLWIEYIFFKGGGFLMALMENCKPLLRVLLCLSVHTSVSRRFTLPDDLMAASCLIIMTETKPHPVIFALRSARLCMRAYIQACGTCASVQYVTCRAPTFEPALICWQWFSWSANILPHWRSSDYSWLVCMRDAGCDEEKWK